MRTYNKDLPISDMKFNLEYIKNLEKHNINTKIQLGLSTPNKLSFLHLSPSIITNMINLARKSLLSVSNGRELINKGKTRIKISTGLLNIDKVLLGGLTTGTTTLLLGDAGSGKTQLCFQLTVNSQYMKNNDINVKTLFIDVTGTFRSERLVEIANNNNVEVKSLLENILVLRPYMNEKNINLISEIKRYLNYHNVKLIIIDDIMFNFYAEADSKQTSINNLRYFDNFLYSINDLAIKYDVAIVLTHKIKKNYETNSYDVKFENLNIYRSSHFQILLDKKSPFQATLLNLDNKIFNNFIITKSGINNIR